MSGRREIRSNIEWKAWGSYDPLYGVCSSPGRNRKGDHPWTDEEFFVSGWSDWEHLSPHWERYGLNTEACVEIGCGVGRMTRVLSEVFGRVYGCDVSPGMLAKARQCLDLDRVCLCLTSGANLPLVNASVTAAFSTIVFQHLSDEQTALDYFREIHRCLKPGGTMLINLPLHDYPNPCKGVQRLVHRIGTGGRDVKADLGRLMLRRPLRNSHIGRRMGLMMYGRSYECSELYPRLMAIGFRDLIAMALWQESQKRLYYYIVGRK